MKILIVYYSRTKTTEKVAKQIAKLLDCDIELIDDGVNRQGLLGYLRSVKEGMNEIEFMSNKQLLD